MGPKPRMPAEAGGFFDASTRFSAYLDIVIAARRRGHEAVDVWVAESPAGTTRKPVRVAFSASEASAIRDSFVVGVGAGGAGRALISRTEASDLGKRLARVLLPGEVFARLAESIAIVSAAGEGAGLRMRLDLDESLQDLPWEYTYRPDRLHREGMSGFLMLDPALSMVRHAANPHIRVEPISRRQRLDFVGTLWEGRKDGWSVWDEFALLRQALEPVARYVEPGFSIASGPGGLGAARRSRSAIFHYAGHCDVDEQGRAFMIRELPLSRRLVADDWDYVDEMAPALAAAGTRLAVLSACNSGYRAVAQPLLDAGIAAVIGVNGGVASHRTIEFCAKLYESLAIGLTLDEAASRARLYLMQRGESENLFDWGLFMVHMPSPQAVLFPRRATAALARHRRTVRQDYAETVTGTMRLAREIDGMNFAEIMSELSKRRVLILGRFTGRRLKVLEGIRAHLERHANRYIPELFTYRKPESRDLVEAIVGFAALSRFVIADLSEPKSLQAELEAIAPHFQSVPIVPVINSTGKEYATFGSVQRRENVIKPTVRYRDLDDLVAKLDDQVVQVAERKLLEIRPTA